LECALAYTPLLGTQQERRHQLVHCDAANAASKNITQDTHLTIACKTGSSTSQKQHAVGCEYFHTMVNSHQLTVYCRVGIHQMLHDERISADKGKTPWSTKTSVCTIRNMSHHDVLSSGILADELPYNHP
jgi:hypothetical protein